MDFCDTLFITQAIVVVVVILFSRGPYEYFPITFVCKYLFVLTKQQKLTGNIDVVFIHCLSSNLAYFYHDHTVTWLPPPSLPLKWRDLKGLVVDQRLIDWLRIGGNVDFSLIAYEGVYTA